MKSGEGLQSDPKTSNECNFFANHPAYKITMKIMKHNKIHKLTMNHKKIFHKQSRHLLDEVRAWSSLSGCLNQSCSVPKQSASSGTSFIVHTSGCVCTTQVKLI